MHLRLHPRSPKMKQIFLILAALVIAKVRTQSLDRDNKTVGIPRGFQRGLQNGVLGLAPDIPSVDIKEDVPSIETETPGPTAKMLDTIKRTYSECATKDDLFKCLKIKALKVAQRAMKSKELELITGIDVKQVKNLTRQSRTFDRTERMNEDQLQVLENESINNLLYDAASNFIESHVININMPKLVEEARRKKKNRYATPFLAALAVKGVIMSMTYKSIAVIAGTALIIGKMALVLAAILGLKKLVSGEKEKTTVEIVKHPTHSSSHTQSSSFEEGEGHYRRSIPTDEEMMILDNINRDSYLN